MEIRSIIVDDNPFNIEVLSDLISESFPQIKILGTADNGKEALELIDKETPNLVFLDVEMPDMNGFEVLASLGEISFQTIFVTAHSHYAIQAIRFNALDYLVKPIDPKELELAIERFQNKVNDDQIDRIQNALENLRKDNSIDQVLYLPTQEGGMKMVLKDIILIEGDRNYSTFILDGNKTKISSKTLGHFEEILHSQNFHRCHRSFIVNRNHISKMTRESFVMSNNREIPISRRRKKEAKEWY